MKTKLLSLLALLAIGQVAFASSPFFGSKDVTSVIPGVSASNLGKAEDAAHGSGDAGVAAWSRRIDDLAPSAGASGDYSAINSDANGALYVNLYSDGAPAVSYTASVTATGSVDAGANNIYTINYCNADASDPHTLKIYDKATAADENDTPIFKTRAVANTCTVVSIPGGLPITNGISLRATAENADTGTTAASANESSATLLLAD